jgi:3-oxoadipate enol-lactonase
MTSGMMAHNKGHIYYEVTGRGEPIVFVHGFTLDHTMWQPQVGFNENYQVVTYDARGFGKSSLPEGAYNHTDDLHALLGNLAIQQAHIVGLSMGGRIATNFALAHPEMVTSLTLMDAALDGHQSDIDWHVHAKAHGLEKAKENWLNHELFSVTQQRPEVVSALRTMVSNYSGWHWLHDDPQVSAKIPARDRLHEIAVPTLVMIGEGDLPDFHTVADTLASSIPGAQKAVIPNAGHMINMEAPDTVNDLLADFIAANAG